MYKKTSKFIKALLEINDICFKYYLWFYIAFLFLSLFKEGVFLGTFGFPFAWFFWFVMTSGALKLIYRIGKIQKIKYNIPKFITYIFYSSFIFYLALIFVEGFAKTIFAQNYIFFSRSLFLWFDLNKNISILPLIFLSGITLSLMQGNAQKDTTIINASLKDYFVILILGVVTGFFVYLKVAPFNKVSMPLSFLSALFIILIQIIILNDVQDN